MVRGSSQDARVTAALSTCALGMLSGVVER
jgi:hypothetical protein